MPSRHHYAAESGLHARPQLCSSGGVEVHGLARPKSDALAKSRWMPAHLSVMETSQHSETIELTAEGDNADEVLDALVANLQTDPEA